MNEAHLKSKDVVSIFSQGITGAAPRMNHDDASEEIFLNISVGPGSSALLVDSLNRQHVFDASRCRYVVDVLDTRQQHHPPTSVFLTQRQVTRYCNR